MTLIGYTNSGLTIPVCTKQTVNGHRPGTATGRLVEKNHGIYLGGVTPSPP